MFDFGFFFTSLYFVFLIAGSRRIVFTDNLFTTSVNLFIPAVAASGVVSIICRVALGNRCRRSIGKHARLVGVIRVYSGYMGVKTRRCRVPVIYYGCTGGRDFTVLPVVPSGYGVGFGSGD